MDYTNTQPICKHAYPFLPANEYQPVSPLQAEIWGKRFEILLKNNQFQSINTLIAEMEDALCVEQTTK